MRLPTLLLVLFAFGLSACASMSAGPRPNGWARPVAQVSSNDRQAEAPRRVEEEAPRTTSREEYMASLIRQARPVVEQSEPEVRLVSTSSGMVIPVVGIQPEQLRDSFDAPRSGGRTHRSIDIAAPTGTPLVAVVDGTITRKHWNRLGGRTLYLTSADGRYDYYYAHLDEYEDGIEIGTEVRQGDVLGTVGATGNAQGPHLHFQVLDKNGSGRGTPVNPFHLLRRAEVALR